MPAREITTGDKTMLKSLIEANNLITGNKIEAMGLSRVLNHITHNAVATISAFRTYRREAYHRFGADKLYGNPEADQYLIPLRENKMRHKALGLDLIKLCNKYKGAGFKSIIGAYQEAGAKASKESSYIVWCPPEYQDKFKFEVINLGTKYEQDAITYQPYKSGFYLISTSPDDIDANQTRIGGVMMSFKGISMGTREYDNIQEVNTPSQVPLSSAQTRMIVKTLSKCFSLIGNRPFFWKEWGAEDYETESRLVKWVVKSMYNKEPSGVSGYHGALIKSSVRSHRIRLDKMLKAEGYISLPNYMLDTDNGLDNPESNEDIIRLSVVREMVEQSEN